MIDRIINTPEYFLSVIAAIVWMVRLEGKIQYNEVALSKLETAVSKLEAKHEALDTRIVEKLSLIERSLAKIEGRLSIENESS